MLANLLSIAYFVLLFSKAFSLNVFCVKPPISAIVKFHDKIFLVIGKHYWILEEGEQASFENAKEITEIDNELTEINAALWIEKDFTYDCRKTDHSLKQVKYKDSMLLFYKRNKRNKFIYGDGENWFEANSVKQLDFLTDAKNLHIDDTSPIDAALHKTNFEYFFLFQNSKHYLIECKFREWIAERIATNISRVDAAMSEFVNSTLEYFIYLFRDDKFAKCTFKFVFRDIRCETEKLIESEFSILSKSGCSKEVEYLGRFIVVSFFFLIILTLVVIIITVSSIIYSVINFRNLNDKTKIENIPKEDLPNNENTKIENDEKGEFLI